MTSNQGVPRICSELMIGLALLRWTPRQFSDYSAAIGYPIPVSSIETGLGVSMNRFSLTAKPEILSNLQETMATLGLGFSAEVFGVTRQFDVRMALGERCVSVADALSALLQNLETPKITLAVQQCVPASECRFLAILIDAPFGARLLVDALPAESPETTAIVSAMYSNWLARLSVVTEYMPDGRGESPVVATSRMMEAPALSAHSLSKARALQLLEGAV